MALIRLYVMLALCGGVVSEGYAPRYAPHKMVHVADIRGLEHAPCMISSAYYDIGVWLYVYGRNTGVMRYCKVVDVSDKRDIDRHRRTGRIIEIAHEQAMELCGSVKSKPTDCPVIVFSIGGTL